MACGQVYTVNSDPCQLIDGKIKPVHASKVHQLFVNSTWSLDKCQNMGRELGEMSALDGCHYLNDMSLEHCAVCPGLTQPLILTLSRQILT